MIDSIRLKFLAALLLVFTTLTPTASRATMPTAAGTVPEPVADAFRAGAFALPEVPPQGIHIAANAPTVWKIPVILISFADDSLTYNASDFERELFDTTRSTPTGSLFDYFRWVSGGRLTVIGKVVGQIRLNETKHYYGWTSWGLSLSSTPNNAYGMVSDALHQMPDLRWSDYDLNHEDIGVPVPAPGRDGYVDMLWVIHPGVGGEAAFDSEEVARRDNLWSITTRMSSAWRNGTPFLTNDPVPGSTTAKIQLDRFTILPEMSPIRHGALAEIGTFCHEFGHALGLPDLYDTSGGHAAGMNTGPGNWMLMSSGAYGANGLTPEYPTHLGAWSLQFLGWDRTFRPAQDTTMVLDPIARAGSVVEWWFQGERNPEHFLIENRQREGFDRNLPSEGLLITHVDESVIGLRLRSNSINAGPTPGLWVVEADGDSDLYIGRNRGEASDLFPGPLERALVDDDTRPNTRSFLGAVTNLALRDILPVGDDVRFRAQVRSPGWLPAEEHSGLDFRPSESYGLARVSVVDDRGKGYIVGLETRSGRTQVVLRSNETGWEQSFQVSQSTGSALDPTLAVMKGGDPVVVWSDTRAGRAQLYYRARIGGTWTREYLLVNLPGSCRNPSVAVDERGCVLVVFQYSDGSTSRIQFMRFSYLAPFGQPLAITGPTEQPVSPSVTVTPDGIAYILWIDRATSPQRIWFSRFDPSLGVSPRSELTIDATYPQLAFSAVVDRAGALHTVWQVIGGGYNQIRYQRRPAGGAPSPQDTLLEFQGTVIQNPMLAVDPVGGLHMVYELSHGSFMQVRYRHWDPARGWDVRSTDVTRPEDGAASHPQAMPLWAGAVGIFYVGYQDGQPHLMIKRREPNGSGQLGVPPTPKAVVSRLLSIGPNPLVAGQALRLSWNGQAPPADPMVDFYDAGGRRVASAALEYVDGRFRGSVSAARVRAWPSGVYFARPRTDGARAARLVVFH